MLFQAKVGRRLKLIDGVDIFVLQCFSQWQRIVEHNSIHLDMHIYEEPQINHRPKVKSTHGDSQRPLNQ
jgi:hypothetical protein